MHRCACKEVQYAGHQPKFYSKLQHAQVDEEQEQAMVFQQSSSIVFATVLQDVIDMFPVQQMTSLQLMVHPPRCQK